MLFSFFLTSTSIIKFFNFLPTSLFTLISTVFFFPKTKKKKSLRPSSSFPHSLTKRTMDHWSYFAQCDWARDTPSRGIRLNLNRSQIRRICPVWRPCLPCLWIFCPFHQASIAYSNPEGIQQVELLGYQLSRSRIWFDPQSMDLSRFYRTKGSLSSFLWQFHLINWLFDFLMIL